MTGLVDLPHVTRALDRIRRLLRAHPEHAERTALYLSGELRGQDAKNRTTKGTKDGKGGSIE